MVSNVSFARLGTLLVFLVTFHECCCDDVDSNGRNLTSHVGTNPVFNLGPESLPINDISDMTSSVHDHGTSGNDSTFQPDVVTFQRILPTFPRLSSSGVFDKATSPKPPPIFVRTTVSHLQNSLPTFTGGSHAYKSMVRWNSLICGGHVCNASLLNYESQCNMAECAECHCDEICMVYGDCCPDVFLTKTNRGLVSNFTCVSQAIFQAKQSSTKGYLAIGDCHEKPSGGKDWNATGVKCLNVDPKDVEGSTPVYSQSTNLHYKNRFCAQCHGVSDVTPWSLKPSCHSYVDYSKVTSLDGLLDLLRKKDDCHVQFIPPSWSAARQCQQDRHLVSTCNVTGHWEIGNYDPDIVMACGIFSEPTQIRMKSNISFKNPFCAYCNGIVFDDLTCPDSEGLKPPNVVPFSIIFNFRETRVYDADNRVDVLVTCREYELYDHLEKRCRQLLCPPGKYPANHSCENFVDSAKGIGYILRYILIPRNSQLHAVLRDIDHFFQSVIQHTYIIRSWVNIDFSVLDMKLVYSVPKVNAGKALNQIRSLDIQFAILVGGMVPKDELEMALINYVKRGWWYYENDDEDPVYFDSEWLTNVNDDRLDDVESPETIMDLFSMSDEVKNMEVHKVFKHTSFNPIPRIYTRNASAYVLVNELMQCNLIELNVTEYNESTSGEIVVLSSGNTLFPGQFTKDGGKVRICTNFSGQPNELSSDSNSIIFGDTYAEVILTLVCTTVSLTGLLITFIVYLLNKRLRTLPGKNNMMLFVNLFMAQLMFQSGSGAKVSLPFCRAIGVIIHYFWLSSFCWKAICAFHMFRVFTNPLKRFQSIKTFSLYVVFAQGLPLLIVGMYVIIHYAVLNRVSFGYGDRVIGRIGQGQNLCFLSSHLDIAFGFVLPIGLVIFHNAILFSCVVYALHTRPKIKRHSTKSDINETTIYLKMSLLLGFSWAIEFIALAWNVPLLWNMFTLVNASIVLFMFFSFGLPNLSFCARLNGKPTPPQSENSTTTETKL